MTERTKQSDSGYDSRPIPDPTVLTTAALQREIGTLKELFETKFEAYDKAIDLLQDQANRSHSISVVEERVAAQQILTNEKLKLVDMQFAQRDTALTAALLASKELVSQHNASSAQAIAKSEANTERQLGQIIATFGETTKGLASAISDLKDRLTTLESGGRGKQDAWGSVGYIIGTMIALAAMIIGAFAFFLKA